jgi:hypothetical protein
MPIIARITMSVTAVLAASAVVASAAYAIPEPGVHAARAFASDIQQGPSTGSHGPESSHCDPPAGIGWD